MKRSQASPSLSAVSQWGIAEFFIVSQTAIPALLFLPGTQGIRFYVRVASFAISMALLAWWAFGNAKNSRAHPAQTWLVVSIVYTAAMVLHPFTSSTLAGIAQIVLYVSVMAPLFWAPAVVRGPDHLARLMTLLLVCNGINAFVGVMQVYDPESLDAAGDVAPGDRVRVRTRRGVVSGTERAHHSAARDSSTTRAPSQVPACTPRSSGSCS